MDTTPAPETPASTTTPAPASAPPPNAGRIQATNLCALALGGCFFLPWMQIFGGQLSGFEFQKLSEVGKFFWLMPIFCGLTLFAGLTGKSQQIAGQLAGAAPFAILAYGLNQFGRNLIDALAPGAWIGLILGVVLFLASRR
ncbi:MAG: hypothetical protein EBS05_07805 [Proteobacteria bacterium]|nr:hypothetical protein [Pseudomonadota bacterium]